MSTLSIKVFGQVEPKVLPANVLVETNKFIEAYKKASELKNYDSFLWEGAWYMVESITIHVNIEDYKYLIELAEEYKTLYDGLVKCDENDPYFNGVESKINELKSRIS